MSVTIQLSEPVSRDAVIAAPAKDFSQAYILHFNVNAEAAGPNDNVNITYCPFDKESGERLLTEERYISVPLWQVMEEVPEAAAAMKAVGDALPILIANDKKAADDFQAAQEAAAQKLIDEAAAFAEAEAAATEAAVAAAAAVAAEAAEAVAAAVAAEAAAAEADAAGLLTEDEVPAVEEDISTENSL